MNDNTTKPMRTIRQEAEEELREERAKSAKGKIKAQLRVVEDARQVLKNEEAKLADLEREIENGL